MNSSAMLKLCLCPFNYIAYVLDISLEKNMALVSVSLLVAFYTNWSDVLLLKENTKWSFIKYLIIPFYNFNLGVWPTFPACSTMRLPDILEGWEQIWYISFFPKDIIPGESVLRPYWWHHGIEYSWKGTIASLHLPFLSNLDIWLAIVNTKMVDWDESWPDQTGSSYVPWCTSPLWIHWFFIFFAQDTFKI